MQHRGPSRHKTVSYLNLSTSQRGPRSVASLRAVLIFPVQPNNSSIKVRNSLSIYETVTQMTLNAQLRTVGNWHEDSFGVSSCARMTPTLVRQMIQALGVDHLYDREDIEETRKNEPEVSQQALQWKIQLGSMADRMKKAPTLFNEWRHVSVHLWVSNTKYWSEQCEPSTRVRHEPVLTSNRPIPQLNFGLRWNLAGEHQTFKQSC